MFDSLSKSITNWWLKVAKLTPEKDCFFIIDYLLVLSGVHLRSRNGYLRSLWNAYRTIFAFHLVLLIRKCWTNLETVHNFQVIVNNLHMLVGITIINMRCSLISRNFQHVSTIRRFVNQMKFRPEDPTAIAIRQRAYWNIIFVTLIMIVNITMQVIVIFFFDIGRSEPLQLPFEFAGISKIENKIVKTIYSNMFSIYVIIATTNFLGMYLPLVTLKTEMNVVVDSFDKIMDRVNHRLAKEFFPTTDEAREEWFWKILHEELNHCIRAHSVVLDQVKNLKKLTDPTFLLLYYMTMLFIAIGVMALMISPEFDSFNVMSLDYSVRYAIESYVFCYVVTKFNEAHNDIVNKLYKFQWGVKLKNSKRFGKQYKQIRSTVLIVMMQSQRSLNFSCGGLFELTMERFTSIMNKSYTLAMYFWNMKKFAD